MTRYHVICENPHCEHHDPAPVVVSCEEELTAILDKGCACGGKLGLWGNPEEVEE